MSDLRNQPSKSNRERSWIKLLLNNRALGQLWIGVTISTIGDFITWIALTWFVTEQTSDGAAVGLMLLIWALPAVVTAPIIGRLMDRYPLRAFLIVDNILRCVLIAALPILSIMNLLSLPLLYLIGGLCGALAPATRVGVGLIIPRVVPNRRLAAINIAFAISEQVAGLLGPIAAALSVGYFGAIQALWIDVGSFAFIAVLMAILPPSFVLLPKVKPNIVSNTDKIRFKMHPSIIVLTGLSGLFWFAYGPTEAALPLYVKGTFNGDVRHMSYLFMAVGFGSLFGSGVAMKMAKWKRTGLTLASIMCLWGVIQVLFTLSSIYILAWIIWFVAGFVWGPYLPLKATFVQRRTPVEHLGRVLGIQQAYLAPMMPLGAALGGFLMRYLTPTHVIMVSGLLCVVGALTAIIPPWLRDKDPDNTFGEVGSNL